MHIVEDKLYRVACHVDRGDLKAYGITTEDLINRTPLGHMFIKKAAELAKESTDYVWPGCAFSMQLEMYQDGIVLIFSERIEDYVYNLRQTANVLPMEQKASFDEMIYVIENSGEDEARELVRRFEHNVKNI
ncbi:MAG: adaptor protein MecA [Lachnospiraceae bacterium]|nr:adaptor protein MecA [Lachnospiraceae bacterium]